MKIFALKPVCAEQSSPLPWTVLLLCLALRLSAQNFEIDWFTAESGGGTSTDGFFALAGSIGQTDTATMNDGHFQIEGGFWPVALRAKPFVALSPLGTNVNFGSPVTFVATPVGSPPFRFQWRLNGIDLPGETNATLRLTAAQLAQGGAYTWVVVNEFGVQSSGPAELAFNLPPGPAANNDLFANRVPIDQTNVIFQANNRNATREAGEPHHGGTLGGASVWYTWATNANGIAVFRTRGSAFDTLLAVYTGSSVSQLTLVGEDDDDAGFLASEVRFNVRAGTPYQIAVDGVGGGSRSGNFVLSWEFEATPETLPLISSQPTSLSVLPQGRATLAVGVTEPGSSFQWQRNGQLLPGATDSTLTLDPVLDSHLGIYRVVVRNTSGREARSRPAALEFGSRSTVVSHGKPGDLLFAAGAGQGGGGGPFQPAAVGASGADAGYNPVSVGPIDYQRLNNAAATSTGVCHDYAVVGGAARYYGLYAVDSGLLTLNTTGSTNGSGKTLDTVLCVYEVASVDDFEDFATNICKYLLQCDNNSGADALSAQLSFSAVAGRYYVAEIDIANAEKGTVQLKWEMTETPLPFTYSGDGLYLTTSTNVVPAGCETCDGRYYWYVDGVLHQTSSVPSLQLREPLRPAASFSVVTRRWSTGAVYTEYTTLTNKLGAFLSAELRLESTPANPGVQLILDGLREPAFRLEATTALGGNAAGTSSWARVTNYVVSTQANSLVLTFPANETNRFYRVRPSLSGTSR